MNIKELQKKYGVAADGIIGPKTRAAFKAARLDVLLDSGHTADTAREHPRAFAPGVWESGPGAVIAERLGFKRTTRDSVEHMLNVAIATAARKALLALGRTCEIFDDPAAANNSELSAAVTVANAFAPRAFVSLHADAQGGSAWQRLGGTATGHTVYYAQGDSLPLAVELDHRLGSLRRTTGGQSNRAESVKKHPYSVIARATGARRAVLAEVGFYDSLTDLLWLTEHIDDLGNAIAKAIDLSI